VGIPDRNDRGIDHAAFLDYIAAFNRNEFDGLARFYADDIVFEGRAASLRGRDELLGFYRGVKSRLRETIAVQDIVVGERTLVADLITELYPLEDWLDFPTGPLRRGETRRSQNFIWYDIEGGRFKRIRAAHYRRVIASADELVATFANSTQPAASNTRGHGRQMTAAEFAAYIEAFNRGDYGEFSAWYDPEVVLVIGGRHELRGPAEICDFYRRVRAQTRRTIRVRNILSGPDRIAAELESEFEALEDIPDFAAGPLKNGDRMLLHTVVLYELRNGRFLRVRSATLKKVCQPRS
jgi:hypothetical protein